MTRGASLLAIGSPHYGCFAANMAISIKANSPDIPIQLICDKSAIAYLTPPYLNLFDVFTHIEEPDIHNNYLFDPGKAKLSLYKYLAWDESIYFDSDSAALKDISPLFDECAGLDFAYQIYGDKTNSGPQWATEEVMREHYGIDESANIPATNTSFMYMRKSDYVNRFFEKALENHSNPLPHGKFKTWGARQPDELIVNVTLAQLGCWHQKPAYPPVYVRGRKASGEVATVDQLREHHYAISVYGYNYSHRSVAMAYDRLMKVYCPQVVGRDYEFKLSKLMDNKWVLNKR